MTEMATSPATTAAAQPAARGIAGFAPWIVAAALIILLPLVFRSGTSLTLMSLMGIAIVFALSFNMLLGQTGMLSFGHAVYYGLGAYMVVHATNWVTKAGWPVPLPLLPLVGGVTGLVFAALFGWVSTKRAGTAFAMISLGLAELVGSSSLILRSFFGGEEGVSTNRTKLLRVFDVNFGSQLQVYYLIGAWCLIAAALMYALTRTPFGRMSNAVRDNPERVQFIGYDPHIIRFIAFCLSGFFAGIAGGLVGINFELANAQLFSASQSGIVLLATFIGGAGHFIGPVLGAILVTYLQNMLSDITEIWQLYFGLMFIAVVMYAPGGLAGLIMMHRPLLKAGRLGRVVPAYLLALIPALIAFGGAVLVIEMIAHLTTKASEGPGMKLFGVAFSTRTAPPWVAGIAMIVAGLGALRFAMPRATSAFDQARAPAGGGAA